MTITARVTVGLGVGGQVEGGGQDRQRGSTGGRRLGGGGSPGEDQRPSLGCAGGGQLLSPTSAACRSFVKTGRRSRSRDKVVQLSKRPGRRATNRRTVDDPAVESGRGPAEPGSWTRTKPRRPTLNLVYPGEEQRPQGHRRSPTASPVNSMAFGSLGCVDRTPKRVRQLDQTRREREDTWHAAGRNLNAHGFIGFLG